MPGKVYLKRDRKKRLEQGHPWVYKSEIERIEAEETDDLMRIVNHEGYFLAQGFYNPLSQIAARVVDYHEESVIDEEWFERRVQEAWERRKRLLPGVRSCRVVYGEADFLPGLVVDKYENVLVVQILSAGMDRRRVWIFGALRKVFDPTGIYERDDVPVRRLEGLEERSGFIGSEFETTLTIEENSLRIAVDVAEGQKTGYFFDQRENRTRLQPFMIGWGRKRGITVGTGGQAVDATGKPVRNPFWDGAEVLDCFSHTGGFMLHACLYGAKKVTCVDISEKALETARENALNNGFLHRTEFVCANVFDYLRQQVEAGRKWDVVILDPPAFAKNRQALPGAVRGYKEINLQGMKLLRSGGILISASCSYHLSAEKFLTLVQGAAVDAKKVLRLVEFRRAGLDHPVLVGSPETDYLKFGIFEVMERH
ncbi:ribosomal RNA large subunit methyltransferase I [Peptococcaceae bacterium CEB3]|nr:ribosomal RNA large subunit methyltransferase I [Peptococcaceae bacterium CEB3]